MADNLISEVSRAIQDGVKARSRFYASLEEPDQQQLSPGVSKEQLKMLEEVLDIELPPSYKAFLLLHNGWKMIDAASDLYSCEEIIDVSKSEGIKRWREIARSSGSDFSESCIIIGGSKFAATKYLLNPLQKTDTGEMAVIEYDKGVEETYESFLRFLQRSSQDFKEAAGDIENGFDFSNI